MGILADVNDFLHMGPLVHLPHEIRHAVPPLKEQVLQESS